MWSSTICFRWDSHLEGLVLLPAKCKPKQPLWPHHVPPHPQQRRLRTGIHWGSDLFRRLSLYLKAACMYVWCLKFSPNITVVILKLQSLLLCYSEKPGLQRVQPAKHDRPLARCPIMKNEKGLKQAIDDPARWSGCWTVLHTKKEGPPGWQDSGPT